MMYYGCKSLRSGQFIVDLPDILQLLDKAICEAVEKKKGEWVPCEECYVDKDRMDDLIEYFSPSKGVPCTFGVDCPCDMEIKTTPSFRLDEDGYVSLMSFLFPNVGLFDLLKEEDSPKPSVIPYEEPVCNPPYKHAWCYDIGIEHGFYNKKSK